MRFRKGKLEVVTKRLNRAHVLLGNMTPNVNNGPIIRIFVSVKLYLLIFLVSKERT